MSIFVSYSSADEMWAVQLERALTLNGFSTWFAPKDIQTGENFAGKIGQELSRHRSSDEFERLDEDLEHLGTSSCFVLLLSGNSMKSIWVKKELVMALKNGMTVKVLQIDHEPLDPGFEYLMADVQKIPAYHLNRKSLETLIEELQGELDKDPSRKEQNKRLTYDEIGIQSIVSGDPWFAEGETLFVKQGKGRFFLAPPAGRTEDPECRAFCRQHHFAEADEVFDTTLAEICRETGIPGLEEMIEESRVKIFDQFLNQENGCYFNNQKYGVADISGFGRTEDLAELPVLRMEMFITDYFTHRVMKDVCKRLAKADAGLLAGIDYNHIGPKKILFTSLGVNLILQEAGGRILLTGRSTNAAETYKEHAISVSVVEGVSISDYDTYQQSVNIRYAVFRGLQEELGVKESLVNTDTLKYYDLFINPKNLEMGLVCSLELKKDLTLKDHVIPLHGKDEQLEIAEKRIVDSSRLTDYLFNNYAAIMPQARYAMCVFLEANGIFVLDRMHHSALRNEQSVIAKDGSGGPCGDRYVWGEHFIAVIDGATPKGEMLWDGQKGDVYVAGVAADAILNMDPEISAEDAISWINKAIHDTYPAHGVEFSSLQPEERLCCSVLIYSEYRHEIWSFGDCMLRINQRDFVITKEGDAMLAALRAFCIQIERDRRGPDADETELSVYGREQILPYLKAYTSLTNRNVPFGYDVLDGGKINAKNVKIYAVQKDDCVVMASDGYPKLFDTLEETEEYLAKALKEDPTCIGILRGTKGIAPGNVSYDDRTYVSFKIR